MSGETPARRRRGRPTRCTPAVRERVCEAIRGGLPLREAAATAGISESTLHDWRARGLEGEGVYLEFLEQSKQAEAAAQAALVAVVHAAAVRGGDWRAALELLGRRWPELYARTVRNEITGPEGGAVSLTLHAAVEIAISRAAAR